MKKYEQKIEKNLSAGKDFRLAVMLVVRQEERNWLLIKTNSSLVRKIKNN